MSPRNTEPGTQKLRALVEAALPGEPETIGRLAEVLDDLVNGSGETPLDLIAAAQNEGYAYGAVAEVFRAALLPAFESLVEFEGLWDRMEESREEERAAEADERTAMLDAEIGERREEGGS